MDVLDDGLVLLRLELLDIPLARLQVSEDLVHVLLELEIDVLQTIGLRLMLRCNLLELRSFGGFGLKLLLEGLDLTIKSSLIALQLESGILEVRISRLRASKLTF